MMKKTDIFYYIILSFLIISIVIVIYFKFFKSSKVDLGDFEFNNFNSITVTDINNKTLHLNNIIKEEKSTYVLIFEFSNCYACIIKGLDDLKYMQKAGNNCLGIVISEIPSELKGWAKSQEFSEMYMMNRRVFYESIHTKSLPVIIKMEYGKIKSYRYIFP